MKKALCLFIVMALGITITACGNGGGANSTSSSDAPVSQSAVSGDSISGQAVSEQSVVSDLNVTATPQATKTPSKNFTSAADCQKENIVFESDWQYAEYSAIHSGMSVKYKAPNPKGITIAVNAGHGTKNGEKKLTYCHPDKSKKVTGGSTDKGAEKAPAVAGGMVFKDGATEASVAYKLACVFRDKLLAAGYDVLMIRDSEDVQLDNIARTIISNNNADFHICLHWDMDALDYNKGIFYIAVPDALKKMAPVSTLWKKHNLLGKCLVKGLEMNDMKIKEPSSMQIDLTQTSYSTIPFVDVEMGNQCGKHDDKTLDEMAKGLVTGVERYLKKTK